VIVLVAAAFAGATIGFGLALTLDEAYGGKSVRRREAPSGRRLVLLTAAAAGLAVIVWSSTSGPAEAAALAVVSALFLALVATDIERHLLPNRLIYPALPVVLLLGPWLPADGYLSALVGAVLGFAILLAPNLAVPGALGAGDVKLGALIGAVVGAGLLLPALTIGVIAGAVASVIFLLRSRTRRTSLAYGPYLILGAFSVLLL